MITYIVCLQSLVLCFGGAFLGGVIARMSKDYRHCRAGLPDLVVWNTSDNTYKVKSHHTHFVKTWCFRHVNMFFKKWCLFVAAGGGEGTQWPSVPEAADLAGWASETGGWRGGLSCGGYWSQRSFFGLKTHRKNENNAANCNWLKTLIKINFWSSTTL